MFSSPFGVNNSLNTLPPNKHSLGSVLMQERRWLISVKHPYMRAILPLNNTAIFWNGVSSSALVETLVGMTLGLIPNSESFSHILFHDCVLRSP